MIWITLAGPTTPTASLAPACQPAPRGGRAISNLRYQRGHDMFKAARILGSTAVFVCGTLLPITTSAAGVDLANGWEPTALEIAPLPDHCRKQFLSKTDPKDVAANSPGCDGVHHYCAGLVLKNRAARQSIPKPERQRIFIHAKKEIGYMSSRPNSSCLKSRLAEVQATQQQLPVLEMLIR